MYLWEGADPEFQRLLLPIVLSGFWVPCQICNVTALFFFFPMTYIKNYREQLTKKSLSEQPLAIILASLWYTLDFFFCTYNNVWIICYEQWKEWQHCSWYFFEFIHLSVLLPHPLSLWVEISSFYLLIVFCILNNLKLLISLMTLHLHS